MKMIKNLFRNKLFIAALVIAAAIGGYYIYKKAATPAATPRYVTAAAAKQSLSVSVSGTGQVASIDQVDIKPNVSGTLTSVNVVQGQKVQAGAIIATIDSRTAARAVADAQTSLETAQLNLEQAKEPTDTLTNLQQKNSLIDAQNALDDAKYNLEKAYDDGYSTVTAAFLDFPDMITALKDTLMGNQASSNQWNMDYYADATRRFSEKTDEYREDAYTSYIDARDSYDAAFAAYKKTDRNSDDATITAILVQSYETALKIATAIKNESNLIQFYKDQLTVHGLTPIALASTHLTELSSNTTTANSRISSLLSAKRAIENDIQAIDDAARSIEEKQAQIEKTNSGPDALEIRSLEITIQQKMNALQDVKDKLADYYVRAPFAGVIAEVNAKKGDSAAASTAIATIISPQLVAEITLNEVDVAKIKTGQKATIAFDALENLSLTGTVAKVDSLGTTSQGVVSYGVQISFDTEDSRVKPGMSVAAAIITAFKADVISVPNTAIKKQGDQTYVQVMKKGKPTRTDIEAGLANDTDTEIISGLNEDDEVVTQTISSSATSSSSTNRTSGGIPGLTGGFGGR
jgi:RND family efflux transporter MFP subunit